MINFDWNKFHDWMIGPINVDWGKGVVQICLHFENDREIEISGLSSISISRHLPWGMSHYINSIKCEEEPDVCRLEIELQSGDTLFFEGSDVSIT